MRRRYWPTFLLLSLLLTRIPLAADGPQVPDVLSEDIARFKTLLSSPILEYRIEGAQGACHLGLSDFEPQLIVLLKDKDPIVRQEVVQALETCGTWRSVIHLIALLDDPDWAVRQHAHLVLRRMTGQTFGLSEKAQWEAWWNATNMDQKQERLLAALQGSEAEAQLSAAQALRCLATPTSEDKILKLLTEGKGIEGEERKLLTEALDRVGAARSMPYLLERAGLGDGAAAWAVGARGGPQAEEALLKGFRRNRNLDFLLNLDRVKSAKCGPFLPALCQNFHSLIRAGYGEDMRYPPSPLRRVSANLIRRSGKGPMLVDLILLEMEGKPKDNAIPDDLKPLFESLRQILKPEFIREGISHMDCLLGAFYDVADDKAIVPRLIPLLRSNCLLVRIYAGMTLGKLRTPEAVSPICEVIKEGYSFCDSTSPASGKHTGEFRVVDGKKVRQSWTVRWLGYLCAALGHIGTEEARTALEAFVADAKSPRDVRYGSVVGLGHIGSPKSLPVLRTVAEKDVVWLIRDTAKRTITDIEIANRISTTGGQGTPAY